MSKTVILFTTYFITPNKKSGLFGENAVDEQKLITGEKLQNFFWDRLKENKTYQENYLANYIKNPASIRVNNNSTDEDGISNLLKKHGIDVKDPEAGKKLQRALIQENKPDEALGVTEELEKFYKQCSEVSLEDKDFNWLVEEINPNKAQEPFDIYIERPPEAPWLYNRLCYYKLKDVDRDDTSVYAIWALNSPAEQNEWIEALTDQVINLDKDVEEIILVLHNKDIGNSGFKVVESSKSLEYKNVSNNKILRSVVVFAHVDEVGRMLDDNSRATAKEMYDFLASQIDVDMKFSLVHTLANGEDLLEKELNELEITEPELREKREHLKLLMQDLKKESSAKKKYELIYEINMLINTIQKRN